MSEREEAIALANEVLSELVTPKPATDYLRPLAREFLRALGAREWREIVADAPPKGRTVLLWAVTDRVGPVIANWKMATGYYADDGRIEWDGRWLKPYDHHPTHWQPLPLPPSLDAPS